jgi:hypothetical protein
MRIDCDDKTVTAMALRRRVGLLSCVVAWSALAGPAFGAASGDAGPLVVRESRELSLTYVGFTARYSCEGLRRHVLDTLTALGAAPGLTVRPYGCAEADRPEKFPSLKISMQVLRPVSAAGAGAGGDAPGAVPSRWKSVQLGGNGKLEAGDCELAEQIRDEILPLFTIRNVQAGFICIPHQETAGSLRFSVEVLEPAEPQQGALTAPASVR